MGAWLVVEALRQLKLSDRDDVLHRIGQVVLASPDIEIDLFRRQVEAIGQLARPILVLTSTDDRALTVSRLIGGSRMRMGSVGEDSPAARRMIEKKAIQIVDLTMLPASDSMKHNRFIRLAEILSKSEDKSAALAQNGMVDLILNFDSVDLDIY
jgi:esterase/lipase superfamily enzyme